MADNLHKYIDGNDKVLNAGFEQFVNTKFMGWSPLERACNRKNWTMVKMLIGLDANDTTVLTHLRYETYPSHITECILKNMEFTQEEKDIALANCCRRNDRVNMLVLEKYGATYSKFDGNVARNADTKTLSMVLPHLTTAVKNAVFQYCDHKYVGIVKAKMLLMSGDIDVTVDLPSHLQAVVDELKIAK